MAINEVNKPPGELMYIRMSRSGSDRLQHEQLGHHVVRRRVVDLHPEEDDALLEELVVRVGLLDPVAGALDEGRQHVPGLGRLETHRALPFPFWVASGSCPTHEITWSTKP